MSIDFKKIFENYPTPVLLYETESETITALNSSLLNVLALSEEMLLNHNVLSVLTPASLSFINTHESESSISFPKLMSEVYTVKAHSDKIYPIYAVRIDETEMLIHFNTVSKDHELMNEFAINANDLLGSIDSTGKLLYVNDVTSNELGYTIEELTTFNLIDLADDESKVLIKEKLAEVNFVDPFVSDPYEIRLFRKDGSIIWLEIRSKIVLDHGEVVRINAVGRNITGRKTAEELLEKSESNLSSLFNSTVNTFLLVNTEYKIYAFNKAAVSYGRLFYRKEMYTGISMFEFIDEYDKNRFIEAFQRAFDGEGVVLEKCFGRKGRFEYWSEIHIDPIMHKKCITGASINILDITNRKLNEKTQKALYEISHASLKVPKLDELFSIIHAALSDIIPSKNICIALLDSEKKDLNFVYYYDEFRSLAEGNKGVHSCEKEIVSKIISDGTPALFSREQILTLLKSRKIDEPQQIPMEVLGIPLSTADRKIIGALMIKNYAEGINFLDQDVKILSFISNQAAMAIQRGLFETKLEEDLKFRESLIDTIPNPILFKDAEGRYKLVNKAYCTLILGKTKDEVIGKTVFELADVIPPELALLYADQDDKALNSFGTHTFESKIHCSDGVFRDFIIHKTTYKGANNEPQGIIIALVDISERIKFEKALQESVERYRSISELISDFAFAAKISHDGTLSFDWITDAFSRITGFSVAELKILEENNTLAHPDDRHLAHDQLKSILAGRPSVQEIRIITKSSEVRWIKRYFKPVFDGNTKRVIGLIGAGQDITDQKNVEEALRKNVEENHALFMSLSEGVLMVNKMGNVMTSNTSAQRILNLHEYDLEGLTINEAFKLCFDDNLKPFSRDNHPLVKALASKKVVKGITFNLKKIDKTEIWISCNSEPLYIPGFDDIYGFVISFSEITQLKVLQEKNVKIAEEIKSGFLRHIDEKLSRTTAGISAQADEMLSLTKGEKQRQVAEDLVKKVEQLSKDLQLIAAMFKE